MVAAKGRAFKKGRILVAIASAVATNKASRVIEKRA
jgi:hypothetical protein